MAERQETSVMASIQDLLRDHQHAEEQEKVQAQQKAQDEERARLDAVRRDQEDAERRVRAEEDARQAKLHDEQRKAAEIAAMQEATIQRARMEAEAQARLAEMAARQEHEKHIHALQHDKSKKTLKWVAIGTGVVLFLALVIGGFALKSSHDKAVAAEQKVQELQNEKILAEQQAAQIKAQLEQTKDPQKIAELEAKLAEQNQKINNLNKDITSKVSGPARTTGGGPAVGVPGAAPPTPAKKCNCKEGDPICTCL